MSIRDLRSERHRLTLGAASADSTRRIAEIDREIAERKAAAAGAVLAPAPRMRDAGQIYVTLSAAEAYAQFARLRPEEARRQLTVLLLDATLQGSDGGLLDYRRRSRTAGVDIDAHVAEQDGLIVVVAVSCRAY